MAQVEEWADGLAEIGELIGPRANAVAYLKGLFSTTGRKNSWTLSEQSGQSVPAPMQRLLSTTDFDPDAVRDDLRSYVVKRLGDRDGVLIVDETRLPTKGNRSAQGVLRYCRAGGQLPDRGVPDLRHGRWAHLLGPGAPSAPGMDRRPGPMPGCRRNG